MLSETQKILSPEFLQFFKSFREANINSWDNATCILALVHWITLENGYLHFIPSKGSTTKLGNVSNQIKTMEDESRVGSFTYIHMQTGLRKILLLHEIYLNGNKLISLFWKDNQQDENTVAFYDKKLRIDLFVKDLNGETPSEAYEFDDIWKLTSMINVGLISERYKKKAFVMTEEAATAEQNGNEQSYYFTLLRWSDSSDWTVPTGLEYLDRMWELNTPNSPLRFVAIHIHKVLVNYHSELKLCMEEEGPTKARNYMQQTGKRVLEAFYGSSNSSTVKQLTITEADDDDGTEGGVFIEFGSQTIRVIKIYEKEYVKNGELDWDNLWKLSVKIRVSLICEQNMDKLKELLMWYLSVETPDKKIFVRDLLVQFKEALDMEIPSILWRDKLIDVDATDVINESIIFHIFHAECLINESGVRGHEMLRRVWEVEKLGAFHLVAVLIHLALIIHPKKLQLATTTGPHNVETIVASIYYQVHNRNRTLVAEYQIAGSGITKQLIVTEGVKDLLFCASFGNKWVPFYVPDLVSGNEWKGNKDNAWNLSELVIQVNNVLSELDLQDGVENQGQPSVSKIH